MPWGGAAGSWYLRSSSSARDAKYTSTPTEDDKGKLRFRFPLRANTSHAEPLGGVTGVRLQWVCSHSQNAAARHKLSLAVTSHRSLRFPNFQPPASYEIRVKHFRWPALHQLLFRVRTKYSQRQILDVIKRPRPANQNWFRIEPNDNSNNTCRDIKMHDFTYTTRYIY